MTLNNDPDKKYVELFDILYFFINEKTFEMDGSNKRRSYDVNGILRGKCNKCNLCPSFQKDDSSSICYFSNF